ncbi:MAG: hypothetical protein L3J04_10165 [Robiginitomaculum sp.]|nr:hypothetical protein [Robiginitomaculum sp.]
MEKTQSNERQSGVNKEIGTLQKAPMSGDMVLSPDDGGGMQKAKKRKVLVSKKKPGNWIVWLGFVLAIMWSAGALAFVIGMTGVQQMQVLPTSQIAGLAFGTIGPALFIFALGWVIRELVAFAGTAASISTMAARFADPAQATKEDASAIANVVSAQMANINKSVEGALARLGAMEEVLNHHADAFKLAETNARERTDELINDLRREREAVGDLADQLDNKAADIAVTIAEQSKMVVSAADIANAQTIEGSKLLNDATEKLEKSASNAITGATRISTKLTQSSEQLDNSASVLDQAQQKIEASAALLEDTKRQAQTSLQANKDEIAELLSVTDKCADKLKVVTADGVHNMKKALEETLDQARHYTSIMREESRSLADSHQVKAKELQGAADEARNALDIYADVIAKRLEQANEASFSAASWADKTFEKLQEATSALDTSLQSLPEAADVSARKVENNLRKRLNDLNQASQLASDEARGIDEAFQSRIRQNYELLSGFMLKMGATASPLSPDIDIPNPLRKQTSIAKEVKEVAELKSVEPQPEKSDIVLEKPQETQMKPEPDVRQHIPDLEIQPQTGEAKATEATDGWRWRDVLSRIDRSSPTEQTTTSSTTSIDRLVDLFQDMNIQPDQLFDKTSYRAAALARITDGHQAMADVVRVDAISAVQSLSSRFDEDPSLREAAKAFTVELREKVGQAADSGQKVHLETHLRTGDGPAYLLLEAALLN